MSGVRAKAMMESPVDPVTVGRAGTVSAKAVAPALTIKVRRSNWPEDSFIANYLNGEAKTI